MHTEILQMFVDSIWIYFKGIGMHFESMRMHSESILMYFVSMKMCSESIQLHFAIIHVYFVSRRMHFKNIRIQFEDTWIYNQAIRIHFECMAFHRFENMSLKLTYAYLTNRKKLKENLRSVNFLIYFYCSTKINYQPSSFIIGLYANDTIPFIQVKILKNYSRIRQDLIENPRMIFPK